MSFNKITPKTQVPVLWNWDQSNVVGTATVHADGQVVIDIIPSESSKRFFGMVTKDVVQSFSVGFTADLRKADKEEYFPYLDTLQRQLAAQVGYEIHKDSRLSGYDLAGDLKARVDEWQPVRDLIKKETEPMMTDKCILDGGVCISHAVNEYCPTTDKKETYQEKARHLVFEYIKAKLEKTDKHITFAQDEVYVVWFSKTPQNWKCLISTTLPYGMYYEVTYNGDQHETYIDAYKKFDNVCVKDRNVGVHIPMVDSD